MRVDIGGTRLFFDVVGAKYVPDGPRLRERPTLIVLHGGPGWDHSNGKPTFDRFADWMQVIYLDHRAHGRSDGRNNPAHWNLKQWGQDVKAFCDALEIEKPAVIGTSFGGMVAQSYGIQFPGHAGKLILASTSARIRLDRVVETFRRLLGPDAAKLAHDTFHAPTPELIAEYKRVCLPEYSSQPLSEEHLARILYNNDLLEQFVSPDGEGQRYNFLPDLHHIASPTLVVTGVDDPITPADDSRDIARAIGPQFATLAILESCRHGIVADSPAGFDLVKRFILDESLNVTVEPVEQELPRT